MYHPTFNTIYDNNGIYISKPNFENATFILKDHYAPLVLATEIDLSNNRLLIGRGYITRSEFNNYRVKNF